MSSIADKITDSTVFKYSLAAVKVSYGYVSERLWPVYSVGMVIGTMMLIASMHEKQILADSLFGGKQGVTQEETAEATQLMDDELHRAVKVDVYRLSAADFAAEAAQRVAAPL